MATLVEFSSFLILMITTITLNSGHPVAKNDLIEGKDFLSIFINQDPGSTNSNHRQHNYGEINSKDINNTNTNTDRPTISSTSIIDRKRKGHMLPIEKMFTSAVNNDDDMNTESSQHFGYNQNHFKTSTQSITSTTHSSMQQDNFHNSYHQPKQDKNILKFVTTGSKIVFLEEISNNNKKLDDQNFQNQPKNIILNDNKYNQPSINDEIKIISVSVSSSSKHTAQNITYPQNDFDNKDQLFISNVHKSDFSIEEKEPFTHHQEEIERKDSVEQGSVHIHSIIAPPTLSAQDSLNPQQTVIIHDQNYQKEGNARPRSVSYSSITQSINQKSWKQSENDESSQSTFQYGNNFTHQHVSEPAQIYSEPEKVYSEPAKSYSEAAKIYSEPSKFYSEPAKVYSEPSKVYGEPEKIYSEPAKVYSEPSRIYSEPSKVYSEPSRVYGEPSKVYGEPSKYYSLPARVIQPVRTTFLPKILSTKATTTTTTTTTTTSAPTHFTPKTKKVIFNLDKLPYDLLNAPSLEDNKNYLLTSDGPASSSIQHHYENRYNMFARRPHEQYPQQINPKQRPIETTTIYNPTPEQNYEIDEAVSVMTNGRAHGVQRPTNKPIPSDDGAPHLAETADPKVGFVVEGRNFRKYRVEEKTADGFIVGEYGVVSNDDGSLRGVRYTADSNINPTLIYEALLKFLSL